MNNKSYYIIIIFFFIGIISRIPFLEKMHSHWDGPDYSIGVVRYSLEQHTPSPPGYPLYIAFGKIFNLFINDPHLSILLVSVFFSGLGAVIFYITASRLFNTTVGLIAGLLFLSGPTFYYFGITANPYGILPLTATIFALVVYEIVIKKKNRGILLGLLFAFAIGIRPQDALFLTPLFFYGILLSNRVNKFNAIISCIIATHMWLIPLIADTGGINNFIQVLKKYSEDALPGFSFIHLHLVWFILVKGLFLSFGIGNLFFLFYLKEALKNKYITLFSLWIFPSLFFNMFLRSDHAAHQMTYLSGLLILISYAIWKTLKKTTALLWVVVGIIVLFNLYTFFRDRDPELKKPYIPQSYHYSEIRKNDLRLRGKVDFVKRKFDPKNTLIVSTEELWRPYSYYLKTYSITALFALNNINASHKYTHSRIDSINWNMNLYHVKNLIIIIPPKISYVVFMDDSAHLWIKNYSFKIYSLPGNSTVTSISVAPKTKLLYDYHSIKIVK